MSLTRREILEQLSRLGIKTIDGLKRGCRDYEVYWTVILGRPIAPAVFIREDPLAREP